MSLPASIAPTESELSDALIDLKSQNPQMGISKIHSLLLHQKPKWLVSEKRTKKVLQRLALVNSNPAEGSEETNGPETVENTPPGDAEAGMSDSGEADTNDAAGGNESIKGKSKVKTKTKTKVKSKSKSKTKPDADVHVFPTSRIMELFDPVEYTTKVEVKYFDKKKGKGLVARDEIESGEVLWREDPFVVAPEWEIYDMQMASNACGHCTTPLNPTSPLLISCAASTSSLPCPTRFCNRLCSARASKTHPLLCPSTNPASGPLLKFTREHEWMALHALTHVTARVMLVNAGAKDADAVKYEWDVVSGMAVLSMEERFRWSFKEGGAPEPDRSTWKKAYALYLQTFKEPRSPQEEKKLGKLRRRPLPENIEHGLFDYEEGFLKNLGRMSLNLEAHGGLYPCHSHLNHSCDPNISVRHLDQRTALSRITVIARRKIVLGEELCITYVNPGLGVRRRQEELKAWGFGKCACVRCVEEEKIGVAADADVNAGNVGGEDELARELKAGLGIM